MAVSLENGSAGLIVPPFSFLLVFVNTPPTHTHKTKPRARRTPPEPDSGASLHSRAGDGSWPLRRCPSHWLALEEAEDQAAVGETEDASRGEAPTHPIPREVVCGGGRGSRGTEATGPRSQTDWSSSPGGLEARTGRGEREGLGSARKEAGAGVRDRSCLETGRAPPTVAPSSHTASPGAAGVGPVSFLPRRRRAARKAERRGRGLGLCSAAAPGSGLRE